MSKTAQAIKSGVVMGGTAILSAVNGLTPHMAGAIDIMVVQQPDGSLKCSPFYVRFGKYTPMRSKDKKVQIFVNGEEACFSMHLGAYGQAYFAAETMEIVSDADEADELLTGMMSPSSGYSSDEDEGGESSTPYANAAMLSAVQKEVARLQAAKAAADASSSAGGGGEAAAPAAATANGGSHHPAMADEVAVAAAAAAAAAGASPSQQQQPPPSRTSSSSSAMRHSSSGGQVEVAAGSAAPPNGNDSSVAGGDGEATLSGSETDGETSSSSSLSDLPSPSEVAQALQQGLAAADGAAANGQQQQQQFGLPPGLPPIATASSNGKSGAAAGHGGSSGSGSSSHRQRRSGRKAGKGQHVAKRVLQVSGDGAAGDPARSRLQDLLLDNRYSIKMQSDESFVAAGGAAGECQQQQHGQQQQQRHSSRSPLQEQQQQQQQRDEVDAGARDEQQQQRPAEPQQTQQPGGEQQQQQVVPIRHVGFQLPPTPPQQQHKPPSKAGVARAAAAAGAAAANGDVHKVHAADLPGLLLDSAASYSMDEVSEVTGATSGSRVWPPAASEGGASVTSSVTGPLRQDSTTSTAAAEEEEEKTVAPEAAAAAAADKAAVSVSPGRAAAVSQQVVDGDGEDEDESGLDTASSHASSVAGGAANMQPQPTLADGLLDAPASAAVAAVAAGSSGGAAITADAEASGASGLKQQQQQQHGVSVKQKQQQQDEQVISPGRASLLSSSLKAQQQMEASTQQQQQQQSSLQAAATAAASPPRWQAERRSVSVGSSAGPDTVDAAAVVDAEVAAVEGAGGEAADATAILEDAAALMPSGWGMHPDSAQQQSQLQQGDNSSSGSNNTTPDVGLQEAGSAAPPAPASDGGGGERIGSAASPSPVPKLDGASSPSPAAALVVAEPPTAAPRSEPVRMPSPTSAAAFATSPPVDSGYLGDSEAGALLGTSYEGATPRRAAAAAAAAAAMAAAAEGVSGPGAGPLALGLAGFQLSLCGDLLRPGIGAAEAQQVFETRRVSAQVWSERGLGLLNSPDLVVKIGGSLYSWQVAAPMVVGMLAFGGRWDSLLGLDTTGMYPIRVAEDHAVHAAKKSSASSSWRLWPFTGWREPSGSSKQQGQLAAHGSSPTSQSAGGQPSSSSAALQQHPPAVTAGGSASATALQPSGGSFTNLRVLLAPGSKSAPGRADHSGGVEGGAAGEEGEGSMGGVGVGAGGEGAQEGGVDGAGRTQSFAGSPPRPSRKKHIILIRKTLTPTNEQLSLLPLRPGANTITFRAGGAADLTAYIYLLRWNTRMVVSDVDGTITRSDLLGHVLPTLGVDWSHPGITQLFHNIARNGYQIMFLSSRAIAQANITREYLHTLVQNDFKMPSGPVIISPHGLLPSLYREIVVRRPHEFKIACLQDIRALFPAEWNPFYAAFGNRDTDELAYREVGVPLSRTFTINPKGQIQKASTAVQSSTWSSLSAINDLVDEMFPGLMLHNNSSSLLSGIVNNAYGGGSSSNGRGLQSVYTSFTDTLEFAAAIGAIEHEQVAAAVLAEQQRRRSSSVGEGGGSSAGGAEAAATAAAAEAAGGGDADEAEEETHGQQQVAAAGSSPTAAAAAMQLPRRSSGLQGGAGSFTAAAAAPVLQLESVGPAREEFNDLHFWRPSFHVDIDSEMAEAVAATAKQPQPAS